MSFRFRRKAPVSKACRQILKQRVNHAIKRLKRCNRDEGVHAVRRDMKKIAAVMRLVRAEIPKKRYARICKLTRASARALSGPRDAAVQAETLHKLSDHFKGRLTRETFGPMSNELRKRRRESFRDFAAERCSRKVESRLIRLKKSVRKLDLNNGGWAAMQAGLARTFSKGRKAYQLALDCPSPDQFHQWRKRAKDLQYQVSLLRQIYPEQLDAMIAELKHLGEYLGDAHDLDRLRDTNEQLSTESPDARAHEMLAALIEERENSLHQAALEIGARFYAEQPKQFCGRLADYWRVWRGKKQVARRAVQVSSPR